MIIVIPWKQTILALSLVRQCAEQPSRHNYNPRLSFAEGVLALRIAYLNPSGTLGGAEISLLDIFASLREAEPKWSLDLIVGNDGPLVKRSEALGVLTKVVPFP